MFGFCSVAVHDRWDDGLLSPEAVVIRWWRPILFVGFPQVMNRANGTKLATCPLAI